VDCKEAFAKGEFSIELLGSSGSGVAIIAASPNRQSGMFIANAILVLAEEDRPVSPSETLRGEFRLE